MINSFLNISDLNYNQINKIISIKDNNEFLMNKNIGLIFEKYSTRTRLSFKVAINNLKGYPIDIRFEELNISREESFEDTFRAMSCYLDGLVFRTTSHSKLITAGEYFKKPIINALSDQSHPCQVLSDLFTIKEHFGSFEIEILWMGDMNNVCFSLVEAVNLIPELKLIVCTPKSISKKVNWSLGPNISITDNIFDINLNNIKCVMTDVFISMNDTEDTEKYKSLLPYSVNFELMSKTSTDSVFMHCLPAKVGVEVTDDVYYSKKSIVWKQAFNRMVAQKKLLQYINW